MACQVKPLCAGEKRTLVSIEAKANTTNQYGGQDVAWTLVRQAWCKAKQMSANERFAHQQVEAVATDTFEFDWLDVQDVIGEEQWRIVRDGVQYNIRSIDNVEYQDVRVIIKAERGVIIPKATP